MSKKIGRSEIVLFTDLLEGNLLSKIDTGAFNSVMHVDYVNLTDSGLIVKIKNNTYIFRKWSEVDVKSSNGIIQKRYAIKTKVKIGTKKYTIFLSLTDRKKMKFPVLIGRRFLNDNKFIVDVKLKNINGKPKKI